MTKWAKGILLIFLIVGFTLAGAVSYTPVAAATNDDSVYETFWSILNREAELVAKLNVTNNTSVANELVKNSQLGAQNAVNISALVWNALEELQKSGVKMYYSPEELRKMAQNISKNGLPKETVQSLKSQGWTDEEINELEEYIAKNADNITSGFNMSTFLQNFSLAFVRVGFKYTYYESWGLYKAFWEGKEKTVKRPTNYTTLINPLLSQDWLNLYKAYTAGDVDKELSSASALSSKMMGLFKSRTGVKDVLKLITRNNDKLLLTSKYKVSRVTHLTDGGLLIYASHEGISKQALSVEYLDKYYWWNALRAYRTLREIQVILGAMKKGNTDPRLRAMLNQKMAQLKDELIVDCVETSTPIRILPNPGPVPIPKPPVSAETRSASLPSAQSTKVSTNKATQLEIFALSPNTNYGYIDNLQVTLEKSVLANGQLEYHIHVSFAVEKNALSNVTVKLSDSRGSDSVHYSVLQVGSQSWDSKSFTTSERILNPGDSVTITGTVTITYTAMDTPTPTSTNSGSEIAGGPKKGEISTSYSFTVTYDDLMQDSRVHIQVIPEPSSSITTDQSVTFQLVITNNNPVPIYGHWDAGIEIPSGEGELSTTKHFLGGVMVNASQTVTVTVATITYESTGDYKYSVTFSFGSSNNKTVGGVIHVSSDSGPAGSLEIKNVTPSPPSPKSGDVVNFTVKVRNAYLTKKDVEVKLFIDGKFADETGDSIPATSDMTFTLHWLAESGQHSYEVKLYSVDENGVKTLVGSWSGEINIISGSNTTNTTNTTHVEIIFLECPKEVRIPGELWCSVIVNNPLDTNIDVTARIRMDGELIDLSRTLGNTNPTLNPGRKEFRIGVNINNDLAQNEFNYNSFLDFLDSEIVTKEDCGHGVSGCQVFNFLPTPHAFSIEIYKGNHLLNSAETTVTLIYGNYYEKKFIEYYIVYPTIGATVGVAGSIFLGGSTALYAAGGGVLSEVVGIIWDTIKDRLFGG